MEYLQEITLDLNSNIAPILVGAKQRDNKTRKILIHLVDKDEPYFITNGHKVVFRITKPDSHVTSNIAEIQSNRSDILVTLSYQSLICSGYAYADIAEFSGEMDEDGNIEGEVLSSATFVIKIEPSPNVMGKAAISSDEFQYLKDFNINSQQILEDSARLLNEAEFWVEIDSENQEDDGGLFVKYIDYGDVSE